MRIKGLLAARALPVSIWLIDERYLMGVLLSSNSGIEEFQIEFIVGTHAIVVRISGVPLHTNPL